MKSHLLICILLLTMQSLLPYKMKPVNGLEIVNNLKDTDNDGLTDEEEKKLGTNPSEPDTDNDGLTDGFETRGLAEYPELNQLNPRHADLIVYFRWRNDISNPYDVNTWIEKAKLFFADLDASNPDGIKGINLVYVSGGAIPSNLPEGTDIPQTYFPRELVGIAHFHEIYSGGAGQTPTVLCPKSSSGTGGTWQSIVHELGHQLGLSHRGRNDIAPENPQHPRCPLYTSLMNYDYSYYFRDNPDLIHLSVGEFSHIVLNEQRISEVIRMPYDRVSFLEGSPYHYKLIRSTTNPNETLIDWNRDGRFNSTLSYVCDINSHGGSLTSNYIENDLLDKTTIGNVCAVSAEGAENFYLLYAADNNLSDEQARLVNSLQYNPANIYLWKKGHSQSIKLTDKILIGELSAVFSQGVLYVCFQTNQGWEFREYSKWEIDKAINERTIPRAISIIKKDASYLVKPQVISANNNIYLFTWGKGLSPRNRDGKIEFTKYNKSTPSSSGVSLSGSFGTTTTLTQTSKSDIGVCWDSENSRICIARTFNSNHPNRLELLVYKFNGELLQLKSSSIIGGETGPNRTNTRPAVIYCRKNIDRQSGKIYVFYKGWTTNISDTANIYCSRQIQDKLLNNGWEELKWVVNTKSNVTGCIYNNDIVIGARNIDTRKVHPEDSKIKLAYNGSGIEIDNLLDYNDVDYIRNVGLKKSLECR